MDGSQVLNITELRRVIGGMSADVLIKNLCGEVGEYTPMEKEPRQIIVSRQNFKMSRIKRESVASGGGGVTESVKIVGQDNILRRLGAMEQRMQIKATLRLRFAL